MTPISFALEILLDCETIEEAHKKCRKFIKLYKTTEIRIPASVRIPTIPLQSGGNQQAPSTQRLLEQHATMPPPPLPATLRPPPAAIDKETGRAIVPTGKGTSGPRKF